MMSDPKSSALWMPPRMGAWLQPPGPKKEISARTTRKLMKVCRTLVGLAVAFYALSVGAESCAGDAVSGAWTILKSDSPGMVDLVLIGHYQDRNSNDEDDWAMSSFPGIDFSKAGRQNVHFAISRDAGKIDCEGFLRDGEGAGTFRFQADPSYAREMQQLGISVDEPKQYRMAVMDVGLEFARHMQAEHLTGVDADRLIAFRIHNVDAAFISYLRAAGLRVSDSAMLVDDDKPPVTKYDVQIVQRARELLDSPSKWNRADTRDCPADAKTLSLYCALKSATDEVTGNFAHRGAAMQEARFVIDGLAPNRKNYHHRLMDYNNDPTTTFADVQKFFRLLEDRIAKRVKEESQ
jgi:hypothetical protein